MSTRADTPTPVRVVTWADGYGRWHATVPHDTRAAARARAAIGAELTARAPRGVRVRVTVERVGYVSGSLATRVEYREALAREMIR